MHPLFVFLISSLILGQDHLNKIPFQAVINSGSTHCFVDSKFVNSYYLKTSATPLVALYLFDSSSNSTISEIANLPIIFFHWWLYKSGLLCHSTWFFLLFSPWIQLACLIQSTDWLGKWVDKLLSIFAGKSRSFLCRSQHTIGISIISWHLSAIIGFYSFHTCIWDLHV